eukprot:TRINITY_DN4992_c0_g1_i7.p2 TRINITY_DN4992_c0_g1~~TRINITY_DN4992_c0_g1_i7.p2  ORF type:complete len:171 (-),score=74.17 TRINITY_DN4992_c0_g1_i7:879-1391(-)
MTLEELREYLQGDSRTLRELQERAKSRRAEGDPELEEIRRERQLLKLQNEKDMEELMKVLAAKRHRELRSRVEKEKIAAGLQALDKDEFSDIAKEKKMELERLEAEREGIRRREESLMSDIQKLSQRVNPTPPKKSTESVISHQELIKRRELEFAKEKAVEIAEIKSVLY